MTKFTVFKHPLAKEKTNIGGKRNGLKIFWKRRETLLLKTFVF